MTRPRLIAVAVLLLVTQTACFEMVRRPAGPSGPGNPEGAAEVTHPDGSAPEPSAAELQEARRRAGQRTRAQRQEARQVNAYALWCMRNSMWNEARSHLEQALAADSLSASLHNNLAIVYEHFGMPERATELYRTAQRLAPRASHYTANLRSLEDLQQAAIDTTGEIDIFDLKRRSPGPSGRPF